MWLQQLTLQFEAKTILEFNQLISSTQQFLPTAEL